ncbi:MAG: guanylate kinase [Flavobacteriales bacterium]|jgi:guanylate kinase
MSAQLKGKAIIFSAPSGAGKTTIVRHLLGIPDLRLSFSVSATSRSMRENEQDGRDYFFLSPDEFRTRVRLGDFLEWEEVYHNQLYGTLRSEIDRIWSEGRNVIFDVDVVGGISLKNHFGTTALSVFVQPPSIEVLEHRLQNRSTESPDKIAMRIAKARHELTFAPRFDMVLINDNLEQALQDAEESVRKFLHT